MAHVRAKPVMREMMVQMLMSAAEEPMLAADVLAEDEFSTASPASCASAGAAARVCRARASLSDMEWSFLLWV